MRSDRPSYPWMELRILKSVNLMPLIISPTVSIVGTMVTVYRTIRKIERKMLNYRAGALRLRAHQRHAQAVDDPNVAAIGRSIFFERLKSKLVRICPCVFRNDNASRSNNARSQKRAVFYMAMSYSLTWALTWIPFYLYCMNPDINHAGNKFMHILSVIFLPLQGLYNLVVYMSPKVRNARNTRRGKLSWRRAISKAWKSKGEKDRAIVGRRRTNSSSLLQRLWSRLSRFVERMRNRISALTSSLKASVPRSVIIQPPSTVKQTEDTNSDHVISHLE